MKGMEKVEELNAWSRMAAQVTERAELRFKAGKMDVHPMAEMLPELSEDEFSGLKASIAKHGLLQNIILVDEDGKIVDGRHRLRACKELSEEKAPSRGMKRVPRFAVVKEKDIAAAAITTNLDRRHLTAGQRAAMASKMATNQHGGDRKSDQKPNSAFDITLPAAAKLCSVGVTAVKDYRKLEADHPELAENVVSGYHSLNSAKNLAEKEPLPAQKKPRKRPPLSEAQKDAANWKRYIKGLKEAKASNEEKIELLKHRVEEMQAEIELLNQNGV